MTGVPPGAGTVEVLQPGPLTTVQDLGRAGFAHLGVGRSGAADPIAAGLANRLLGNPPGAATLETTFGGLVLRFGGAAWIAVTGAPAPLTVAGRARDMCAPVHVPAGGVVRIGRPTAGVRTYLAVRGGFDVPPVLGSRSTDLLGGIGPAPAAAGTVLPIGDTTGPWPGVDFAPVPAPAAEVVLRVLPGPRDDWFTPDAPATLTGGVYTVGVDSDRVGLRLRGPALTRRNSGELPSEGMVPGALQVPPDGMPVLFLADSPATGGYPVVAVVLTDDLPAAGQLAPGGIIRFRRAGTRAG